jgi:DNA-nicking Smr family endonuclease
MKGRGKSVRKGDLPFRSLEEDMPAIDLHGHRQDEAEAELEGFLRQELREKTQRIKIIYGTNGHALRDATRNVLRRFGKHIESQSPFGPGVYVKLKP